MCLKMGQKISMGPKIFYETIFSSHSESIGITESVHLSTCCGVAIVLVIARYQKLFFAEP